MEYVNIYKNNVSSFILHFGINHYELNELKNDLINYHKYDSTYSCLSNDEDQLIREECFITTSRLYDKISREEIQFKTDYNEKNGFKLFQELWLWIEFV